jgi:glutathione peroxidase
MNDSKIYSIEVKDIGGKSVKLSEYHNKVMLIVNVASKCGFTNQYEGLEKLYQKFKGTGLEVLGFPCNQFGSQEPGNEEEIKSFCSLSYNVTFPMFAKVDVNGAATHPLFELLKKEEKGILGTEGIKWNFTKFLVDRQGQIVARYSPQTKPEDLDGAIEKLLA